MTPTYEQWLLHRPPVQLATPLASTSLNKRQCTESTSSSHTESSHTQTEHEKAWLDLVEERVSHAQIKATLEADILLCIEAEVSHECTQHWNETQAELIHSLKCKLINSRTSHEDLGYMMRRNNSMAFVQD